MNGKTVITQKSSNARGNVLMNVSQLKPGLYVLKIAGGAHQQNIKFIKENNQANTPFSFQPLLVGD